MFNLSKMSSFIGNRNLFSHILKCNSQIRLCSKAVKDNEINKIRNLGIIAHIDAGKTTTTERMLYYSGFIPSMGEVHDGDTVTDYMVQERERGITITSAAITFNWKKHKLNLIDTPGHVDFTFEVERCLRVLDGAVVILDASAGVEVQTLKVWEQATRYDVPCIIYLNKMDKPAANIKLCIESIKNKLKVRPLLLHVPVGESKDFCGVVDLVTFQKYVWNNVSKTNGGRQFTIENFDVKSENEILIPFLQQREDLIEHIADLDDIMAEKFLIEGKQETISAVDVLSALRRITLNRTAIPVLIGSSYKNIAVQLLMDAIINYLPNPLQRPHIFTAPVSDKLCALVFKTTHNKNKDPLTYLRVFSGCIKNNQKIYNKNSQNTEKICKLMVPLADDFKEVPLLSSGNIAVAIGLKDAKTGDMLFDSASSSKEITSAKQLIQVPDPVFFCTIEPPSPGQQKNLDFALQCLQREDPTFRVEVDETIGQTIIMGMGELHIDIIKDRIRSEFNVDAYLGPLQVAYRESPTSHVEETKVLDKTVTGLKQFAKVTLRMYPSDCDFGKQVKVIVTKENELGNIRQEHLKAVSAGVKNALNNGPLLSFPVINVGVDLLWLEVGRGTSMAMLTALASQCLTSALRKSTMCLLEPIMKVSIVSNQAYAGRVLTDLSQKRSQILNMDKRQDIALIQTRTPLSELCGYSSHLRALTAGSCTFTLEFDNFEKMDSNEQARTVQEITGFSAV